MFFFNVTRSNGVNDWFILHKTRTDDVTDWFVFNKTLYNDVTDLFETTERDLMLSLIGLFSEKVDLKMSLICLKQ